MSGPKARLAIRVADALRTRIVDGSIKTGDRLPSETRLAELHGVSRTVVREAIAALSFEGLVQARKGAGIFVRDMPTGPFLNLDMGRLSSVIELLELRRAVEVESAGLAAARKSAVQEERIIAAQQAVDHCLQDGMPTRDADFEFHLSIAEATNNRRFIEFLTMIRVNIIPRGELQTGRDNVRPVDYNRHLREEHDRIVATILDGDESAARLAMQEHLKGSLARYRVLLRGNQHTGD